MFIKPDSAAPNTGSACDKCCFRCLIVAASGARVWGCQRRRHCSWCAGQRPPLAGPWLWPARTDTQEGGTGWSLLSRGLQGSHICAHIAHSGTKAGFSLRNQSGGELLGLVAGTRRGPGPRVREGVCNPQRSCPSFCMTATHLPEAAETPGR